MSAILIPRRSIARPSGRVALRSDYPFLAAWNFAANSGIRDLVSGVETAPSAATTQYETHIGVDGIAGGFGETLLLPVDIPLGAFSVVTKGVWKSGSVCWSILSAAWNGVYAEGFTAINSTASANFDGLLSFSSAALDEDGFQTVALSRGQSNEFYGASSGVARQSDTATSAISGTASGVRIGGAFSDNPAHVHMSMFAVVSGTLPIDELDSLSVNPWQLFRADPVRFYSLPSGAITLNSLMMGGFTSSGASATLGITR